MEPTHAAVFFATEVKNLANTFCSGQSTVAQALRRE